MMIRNDKDLERECFYNPSIRKQVMFMQLTYYGFWLFLLLSWGFALYKFIVPDLVEKDGVNSAPFEVVEYEHKTFETSFK